MEIKFRLRDTDPWESLDGEGIVAILLFCLAGGGLFWLVVWLLR